MPKINKKVNKLVQLSIASLLVAPLYLKAEAPSEAEVKLDEVNQTYLQDVNYQDEEAYPDLAEILNAYKQQFMQRDTDSSGDIDLMELKSWMTELKQSKTHLELKKMISEVDRENLGSISYNDFVYMRLGKKSSIFKLILTFDEVIKEEKGGEMNKIPKANGTSLSYFFV